MAFRGSSWPQISRALLGAVLAAVLGAVGLETAGLSGAAIAQQAPYPETLPVPPPEDIPEEILRTEVIFEARSPLDGSPMAPAAYAQLQQDLAASQTTLTLNSNVRSIFFLLQTRRALKPLIPFLP